MTNLNNEDQVITDKIIKEAEIHVNQMASLGGNIDPVHLASFKKWYDESPIHAKAYALVFICHEDNIFIPEKTIEAANDNSFFKKWSVVAAGLFVAFLGYDSFLNVPHITEYRTAVAQIQKITLKDNSQIILGASSVLKVEKFGSDERRVYLMKGEAYFDIASDPLRPFIVVKDQTKIEVLGTKFNVNISSNALAVSLLEGKVKIRQQVKGTVFPFLKTEQNMILTPAHTLLIRDGEISIPKAQNIKQMANWTKGRLSYFNAPLSKIISDINRYSVTPFIIRDKELLNMPVTAIFGVEQTEMFMNNLPQILPVIIKVNSKGHKVIFLINKNKL